LPKYHWRNEARPNRVLAERTALLESRHSTARLRRWNEEIVNCRFENVKVPRRPSSRQDITCLVKSPGPRQCERSDIDAEITRSFCFRYDGVENFYPPFDPVCQRYAGTVNKRDSVVPGEFMIRRGSEFSRYWPAGWIRGKDVNQCKAVS
jgi:hypothetical protein